MQNEKSVRALSQRQKAVYWIFLWLVLQLFIGYGSSDFLFSFSLASLLFLFVLLGVEYLMLPINVRNLDEGRYLPFILKFAIVFLALAVCITTVLTLALGYFPGLRAEDLPPLTQNITFLISFSFLLILMTIVIRLWADRTQIEKEKMKLGQVLVEKELALKVAQLHNLKGQVNPHFLFNTLNTLYGLALQNSSKTPEMVLKLSNLLEYGLYHIEKDKVLLTEELKYLKEYVAVELERFKHTVMFRDEEHILFDHEIAPFLFLPLIENVFKHGDREHNELVIALKLKSDEDSLYLDISNNCKDGEFKFGLGLSNIRDRLNLIYGKRAALSIEKGDGTFRVQLRIDFSGNG